MLDNSSDDPEDDDPTKDISQTTVQNKGTPSPTRVNKCSASTRGYSRTTVWCCLGSVDPFGAAFWRLSLGGNHHLRHNRADVQKQSQRVAVHVLTELGAVKDHVRSAWARKATARTMCRALFRAMDKSTPERTFDRIQRCFGGLRADGDGMVTCTDGPGIRDPSSVSAEVGKEVGEEAAPTMSGQGRPTPLVRAMSAHLRSTSCFGMIWFSFGQNWAWFGKPGAPFGRVWAHDARSSNVERNKLDRIHGDIHEFASWAEQG